MNTEDKKQQDQTGSTPKEEKKFSQICKEMPYSYDKAGTCTVITSPMQASGTMNSSKTEKPIKTQNERILDHYRKKGFTDEQLAQVQEMLDCYA